MKLGELHKALGVSGKSFNSFMSSGASKVSESDTYPAAFRFFQKREEKGIKIPTKKAKKGEEPNYDFSDIHLEGEQEVAVPVHDTCDEVRKKINAHMKEPGRTKAAFLRDIAKTYPEEKSILTKSLNDFLNKKGPLKGNTSAVYYAAYVFFEKMRLKNNKPKSKHRQEVEKRHPNGIPTDRPLDRILCMAGEIPTIDQYGDLHIHKR
jgi:hypothetical protein